MAVHTEPGQADGDVCGFTTAQKSSLLDLVRVYVGNMDDVHAWPT
ncbi:hypothetical protein ABZT03_40140 [Streptomyces sp. NPDC005574]